MTPDVFALAAPRAAFVRIVCGEVAYELCRVRRNDAGVQVDVYQPVVSLGVVQRLRHGLVVSIVPAVREQVFVKACLWTPNCSVTGAS